MPLFVQILLQAAVTLQEWISSLPLVLGSVKSALFWAPNVAVLSSWYFLYLKNSLGPGRLAGQEGIPVLTTCFSRTNSSRIPLDDSLIAANKTELHRTEAICPFSEWQSNGMCEPASQTSDSCFLLLPSRLPAVLCGMCTCWEAVIFSCASCRSLMLIPSSVLCLPLRKQACGA